jgi:hypothetical protein
MLRVGLILIWSTLCLWSAAPAHMQSECLIPRFLPGQSVKVTGSVDAGGLPYRAAMGLDQAVQGFIPLETRVTAQEGPVCSEERNWYRLDPEVAQSDSAEVWVTDGDGRTYWLEPLRLGCGTQIETRPIGYVYALNSGEDEKTITISTAQSNEQKVYTKHHYSLDLETGILTPTADPDLIPPELLDQLGIEPVDRYPPQLSPDGTQILYFIPEPPRENCAEGCVPLQVYIANVDGSHPVLLGRISLENNLWAVHWGANHRLYLTIVTEAAPAPYLVEYCMDGGCEHDIGALLRQWGVSNFGVLGFASVSPDGKQLAVERIYGREKGSGTLIIDLAHNTWIELPDNGDVWLPVIWENNTTIDYPVDADSVANLQENAPDRLLRIELDFDKRAYHVINQYTYSDGEMFGDWMNGQWLRTYGLFFTSWQDRLGIYCFFAG